MSAPTYRLRLDGQDLTPQIHARLISLSLEETRGDTADQLDLVLSDHDGALALPRKGVKLQLSIGFIGQQGLVNKGSFVVDEVEHSGAPDIVTIRARSADMRESLRVRRDQSWHATTLGTIIKTIAARHRIDQRIAPELASVAVSHIDQTNESDLNFVTRLAKRFDAVATIKAGALLFLPINGSQTASGTRLPTLAITRSSGDSHHYTQSDRDAYTGVRAYWHDGKKANRKGVLVGTKVTPKTLKDTYATEADAMAAAQAEWQRIQRGLATLKLTLAIGVPSLVPQSPVTVQGFKQQIDGTQWLATRVTHKLDDSGLTTEVELETGMG